MNLNVESFMAVLKALYEHRECEIIESQGIPIRVATIESLIKLKEVTIREIDRADVILLMEKLGEKK